MARRYESTENAIKAFANSFSDVDYSPKTRRFYFEQSRRAVDFLPRSRSLYDVTQDDVKTAVANMRKHGLAVSTIKDYSGALLRLLAFVGNHDAANTRITHQADVRPNVDWLTPDQAKDVLECPKTAAQQLAIVLALGMGLRKIEIIRLKMSDINTSRGYITVTGKGRGGGKLRLVPFHPRFNDALGEWLKVRHTMTQGGGYNPDNLLVWQRGKHCYAYSDVKASGIHTMLKRVSIDAGIPFSFHTLRRTFGRLMWLSGVPVVTIAKMLGHTSTEQTLAYIGANMDDMAAAMVAFSLQ